MRRTIPLFVLMLLLLAACTPQPTATGMPAAVQMPQPTDIPATEPPAPTGTPDPLAEIEARAGFDIQEPAGVLPEGYGLEDVTLDEATGSVCLQYRYAAEGGDSVLFIAQGPIESAPAMEVIPDLPEYLLQREAVSIGGAENSSQVTGYRRSAWACAEAAAQEVTTYSYAVAPRLTWEVGSIQFDLYSTSGGCATPGGLTNLGLLRVAESLTGNSTHPASELDPECLLSVADVESLAGFDVIEPASLPEDVAFYYATYEEAAGPTVTLLYLHEQHPDMGRFFQITQAQEAPTFLVESCEGVTSEVCEVLQVGEVSVVYLSFGPSEQLDWQADGFYFSLFRSAGEPGKDYKDMLLEIVGSMR